MTEYFMAKDISITFKDIHNKLKESENQNYEQIFEEFITLYK